MRLIYQSLPCRRLLSVKTDLETRVNQICGYEVPEIDEYFGVENINKESVTHTYPSREGIYLLFYRKILYFTHMLWEVDFHPK